MKKGTDLSQVQKDERVTKYGKVSRSILQTGGGGYLWMALWTSTSTYEKINAEKST